jgi:hypothetical protein
LDKQPDVAAADEAKGVRVSRSNKGADDVHSTGFLHQTKKCKVEGRKYNNNKYWIFRPDGRLCEIVPMEQVKADKAKAVADKYYDTFQLFPGSDDELRSSFRTQCQNEGWRLSVLTMEDDSCVASHAPNVMSQKSYLFRYSPSGVAAVGVSPLIREVKVERDTAGDLCAHITLTLSDSEVFTLAHVQSLTSYNDILRLLQEVRGYEICPGVTEAVLCENVRASKDRKSGGGERSEGTEVWNVLTTQALRTQFTRQGLEGSNGGWIGGAIPIGLLPAGSKVGGLSVPSHAEANSDGQTGGGAAGGYLYASRDGEPHLCFRHEHCPRVLQATAMRPRLRMCDACSIYKRNVLRGRCETIDQHAKGNFTKFFGHSRLTSREAMLHRMDNMSTLLRHTSSENLRLNAWKIRAELRRGEVELPAEQSDTITGTLLHLERIISVCIVPLFLLNV